MLNALAASAVLPDHLPLTDIVDLRTRAHICESEQRPAWNALSDHLLLASRQHSHELHIEIDGVGLKLHVKTPEELIEHRFTAEDPFYSAVQLLKTEIWPDEQAVALRRRWFLMSLDNHDYLHQIDCLISSTGYNFSIRRLYDVKTPLKTLDQLLTLPAQCATVRTCLEQPKGLILLVDADPITRTITARALAQSLTAPNRRILLAENSCHPVVPGTTQFSVPNDAKLKRRTHSDRVFEDGALNMNHDVIISQDADHTRDKIINMADQERLVIQGIGARTPGDALARLTAKGVRPESLARTLKFILVQHRLMIACDQCKIPAPGNATLNECINQLIPIRSGKMQDWLAERMKDNFVQAGGCEACYATGVGKTMLTMICIPVSKDLQDALYDGDIRYVAEYLDRADTSKAQIIQLARQGLVSVKFALSRLSSA